MKVHNIVMATLATIGVLMIAFAAPLNVGAGFGILFLICPIMMLSMVYMMGRNNK